VDDDNPRNFRSNRSSFTVEDTIGAFVRDGEPRRTQNDFHFQMLAMSLLTKFGRWLHLKQYQMEVTFSVYIFTPVEKFVFCTYSPILFSPHLFLLPSSGSPYACLDMNS
jgi:hypothetical protein